jgi:hypothetical protein
MNHSPTLIRKIVYILIICLMIFPLLLVGFPQSKKTEKGGSGGMLAQMSDKHGISQANFSEIDPGSESMKLISLGMRGIATNLLWTQANEAQKKGDYDTLKATLRSLTMIQPTFVSVWRYQAHNLSYNISVEFDDFEQRFHWVKQGILFLTEGMPYNRRDHRIIDSLGFFTGSKIGVADEKKEYRQLFRTDSDFHKQIEKWHTLDEYNCPYRPDNWLLAYQWYSDSRDLVKNGYQGSEVPLRISPPVYYMHQPAQLRQHAMALHREFGASEYIKSIWTRFGFEWTGPEYGLKPFNVGTSQGVTMEKAAEMGIEIERMLDELDKLVPPGTRDQVMQEIMENAPPNLKPTEEEKLAMEIPIDERTPQQQILAQNGMDKLFMLSNEQFILIGEKANEENRMKARELVSELMDLYRRRASTIRYEGVVNYVFWKQRAEAEQLDDAVKARQAIFEAKKLYRQGRLDWWNKTDEEGNAVDEKQKGAIQLFLEGFEHWAKVLDTIPELVVGPLSDDITDDIILFKDKVLAKTQADWPDDFPLQKLIDKRAANQEEDDLPTTEMIERQKALSGDSENESSESNDQGEGESGHVPSDLPPTAIK